MRPSQRDEIIRLMRAGKEPGAIAEKLRISQRSVSLVLRAFIRRETAMLRAAWPDGIQFGDRKYAPRAPGIHTIRVDDLPRCLKLAIDNRNRLSDA